MRGRPDWRHRIAAGGMGAVLALAVGHAAAQPAAGSPGEQPGNPSSQQTAIPGPGPTPGPSYVGDIYTRGNLLGDLAGARSTLARYGVSVGLQESSEVFGNTTGGVHTGAVYNGVTILSLGVDTGTALGWDGGSFDVSALQIHGRSLSADNLHVIQAVSGIEAERSTRLWELWFQQSALDGRIDVKLGQQSLDQEFMISQFGGLFLNSAMGWPALAATDQYSGGPAYPFSSLGVRLRGQPTSETTVLFGVFDDNPAGGPFGDDTQTRGAAQSGTAFNLGTGALIIAEVQYAVNQPAPSNPSGAAPPPAPGLPATYKLGAWVDTGGFPDPRFDAAGRSLADPAGTGLPKLRRPNFSVYGVVDQMVWRPDPAGPRSVGVFLRPMGAPGDRNQVDFSVNGGVTLKAPLPGRDNDTFGIGFGVARLGDYARGFDKDVALFSGLYYPVRSVETFVEVTYQYQPAPWVQLQPDFQYLFHPRRRRAGSVKPRPSDRQRGRVRAAIKRRVLTVALPSNFAVATTAVPRSAPRRASALTSCAV